MPHKSIYQVKQRAVSELFYKIKKYFIDFQQSSQTLFNSLKAAAAFVALAAMPELYLLFTLDENRLEKELRASFDSTLLNFSYDGITFSFYEGIALHNFQISLAPENQSIQKLSANIKIKPPLLAWIKGDFHGEAKAQISDASWNIRMNDPSLKRENFLLLQWLLDISPFKKITLNDNQVTFIIEHSDYQKERWIIQNINASAENRDGKWQIELEYDDIPWGSGKITFQPDPCSSCEPWNGQYRFELMGLPLNRLSWALPDRSFTSGFGTLQADVESNPASSSGFLYAIDGSLTIEDLKAAGKGLEPFEAESLLFDFHYSFDAHKKVIGAKGSWNGYPLELSTALEGPQNRIQYIKYSMRSGPDNLSIDIPGGWSLTGIQEVELDLSADGDQGSEYKIAKARLNLSESKVKPPIDGLMFFVPQAELAMNDNEYTLQVQFEKGESAGILSSQGSFTPKHRNVVIFSRTAGGIKKKRHIEPVLSFFGEHQAALELTHWNWADFQVMLNNLKAHTNQNIVRDIQDGWKESAVRERRWFQQYIYPTSLNMTIHAASLAEDSAKGEIQRQSWEGVLAIQNSYADFSLESPETKEYLHLDWSGRDNYPDVKASLQLRFFGGAYSTAYLFSPHLFSLFNSALLEYSFYTGGERLGDLFLNHRGKGSIAVETVTSPLAEEYGGEVWSTLNADFSRWGARAGIYNIRAENETYRLRGSGLWVYEGGHSNWKINSSVAPQ